MIDACEQAECLMKVFRANGYGLEAHEILEIVDEIWQEESEK